MLPKGPLIQIHKTKSLLLKFQQTHISEGPPIYPSPLPTVVPLPIALFPQKGSRPLRFIVSTSPNIHPPNPSSRKRKITFCALSPYKHYFVNRNSTFYLLFCVFCNSKSFKTSFEKYLLVFPIYHLKSFWDTLYNMIFL